MCAFTVARHILVDKTYLTTFSDGTQRYTGAFKLRLTNLTTGKYVDFNVSGSPAVGLSRKWQKSEGGGTCHLRRGVMPE